MVLEDSKTEMEKTVTLVDGIVRLTIKCDDLDAAVVEMMSIPNSSVLSAHDNIVTGTILGYRITCNNQNVLDVIRGVVKMGWKWI